MQKNQSKEKAAETKAPITSLAELQKFCSSSKPVEFVLDGNKFSLTVRRLSPAEQAKINEIVEAVVPNVIKGKLPEDDRLDTTNAEFVKKKNDALLKARAQALYWAVAAFKEAKPGMTDATQITDFIQGQLTESVLNILWQGVQDSGISLAELLNFT